MKKTRLILLAALIFAPAITHAVTAITSLPYTIATPGAYVLESSLTANNSDGIDVMASNVSINLGGYTLQAQGTAGFPYGIRVFPGMFNVSIQNGSIVGFSQGVYFNTCSQCILKKVRLFATIGNSIIISADDCLVENCFIVGNAAAYSGSAGISIESSSGAILIKDNQISEFYSGIEVFSPCGPIAVIGNYEANCQVGLGLGPGSKYQGNITTNCDLPVSPITGGTAVGKENG